MAGVIAAGDSQTAAAGAAILAQGGNAVDGVVAAAFASFVAESVLVNIGGGGVGLVHDPQAGAAAYDFFSTMPTGKLTTESDFREVILDFGPAQQSFHIGRASVAVPGVVAGLCRMAHDRGRLPLAQLLQPAVDLARNGAVLSPGLDFVAALLTRIFTDTPGLAALYAPQGRMIRAGDAIVLPQLADTLALLGKEGPDLFATGSVAQTIVADQAAHGGLITRSDLADYRVRSLPPITVAYRGHTVLLPPPSSGGVLIAFALSLLDGINLAALPHNSPAHLRILAEAMRQTNLARQGWERSVGSDAERIRAFLHPDHLAEHARSLRAALALSLIHI